MKIEQLKYMVGHTAGSMSVALAHVCIANGRMQAGNGRYTVDCPCDLPDATVHGDKLLAAFQACRGEPMATFDGSVYTVKAGRTRARLPVLPGDQYPRTTPDPETKHTAPGITTLLQRIGPFVATDASRAWATSVCIKDGHADATNNVVLCRMPFPADFGLPVNIPGAVFEAIVALGEPIGMGVSDLSATFYFDNDTWIKTQLIAGDWPTTTVDQLVNSIPDAWETIHPSLPQTLDTAARISGDRHPVVKFTDGGLALMDDSFSAEDLEPLPAMGKVNARMVALVFDNAEQVQWHTPKQDVHAFRQGDLIGVFGGQR